MTNSFIKLSLSIVMFVCISLPNVVFAQQAKSNEPEENGDVQKPTAAADTQDTLNPTLSSRNESWYVLVSLGPSKVKYNSRVETAMDQLESTPGADHSTPIGFELSVYWPHPGHKSMHGATFDLVSDSISLADGDSVALSQKFYGYSYQAFLGQNIGDGFFWRGDAGITRFIEIWEGNPAYSDYTSDTGWGLSLGGGHSWPTTQEGRVTVSAILAKRKADSDNGGVDSTTISVRLGFLF